MPDLRQIIMSDDAGGQHSPVLQRSVGVGRISVAEKGGCNRLVDLYQEGAARIRLPRTHNAKLTEIVLINTSGGMTGGDRYRWGVDAAGDATTLVTTQACEKIYRRSGGVAEIHNHISLSGDARLAWLPQETILFDGSAVSRTIDVDLGPSNIFLMVEPLIIGRQAMGETVQQAHFRDRWRIWSDTGLIHADDVSLSGDVPTQLNQPCVCDGDVALANILAVGPGVDDILPAVRQLDGLSAASVWQVGGYSKLLIRMTAPTGRHLRARLMPGLDLLLSRLFGLTDGLPKVWNL